MTKAVMAMVLGALLAMGCGFSSVAPSDGVGGAAPLAAGTGGAGGASTCPTAGRSVALATVGDMRAALARQWLLCSPLGLTHNAQAGLEITPDDRYALLQRDASGALVAERGVDFEGSVDYVQVNPGLDGGIQVDLSSDLGGTVITRPVITQDPATLIINNNGVYEYRYVAVSPGEGHGPLPP